MTLKPDHSRSLEPDRDRSVTYYFLLILHSNHKPISYRFRDKRQFQSKIAKFSHPRAYCVPADGVPLGNGYQHKGLKKLEWLATRWSKRFQIGFTLRQNTGVSGFYLGFNFRQCNPKAGVPSLPAPLPPPLPRPTTPSLPLPAPPLPLEVGSLKPARGSGERCKLPQRGLERSPSRNRIWCILAAKYDIWWQQF